MLNVIEIAISLMMVFLMVSLIVTAINEVTSRVFSLRAKTLWTGIRSIIDDDELRKRFYGNGLIARESESWKEPFHADSTKGHPSYIAPENFAKSLTMAVGLAPSGSATKPPMVTFDEIEKTVAAIKDAKLRDVLISALSDAEAAAQGAEKSLKVFEKSLADWYSTTMDRLGGLYRRTNQTMSFCLGLLIAVGLNIDALGVALTLNSDNEARSALVAKAVESVSKEDVLTLCGQDLTSSAGPASGASTAGVQAETATDEKTLEDIGCFVDAINPMLDELTLITTGWNEQSLSELGWLDWIAKLIGWLITAFAVTLGAPFWFDLLKRFVNIRSTGDKPKKSQAA